MEEGSGAGRRRLLQSHPLIDRPEVKDRILAAERREADSGGILRAHLRISTMAPFSLNGSMKRDVEVLTAHCPAGQRIIINYSWSIE
jgi:hypothetical protein